MSDAAIEAFEQTWPTTRRTFARTKWLATAVAVLESQASSCTSRVTASPSSPPIALASRAAALTPRNTCSPTAT